MFMYNLLPWCYSNIEIDAVNWKLHPITACGLFRDSLIYCFDTHSNIP